MRKTLLTLTSIIAISTAAFAETDLIPFDANFEMVEEHDATTGVPYVTGGVGKEELERIKDLRSQYNTTISIADVRGFFLANIMVNVLDKDNVPVLSAVSKGPYILTTLPAGTYTVKASQGPNYVERKLKVPAKGSAREVILLLPSDQPVYGKPKMSQPKPTPAEEPKVEAPKVEEKVQEKVEETVKETLAPKVEKAPVAAAKKTAKEAADKTVKAPEATKKVEQAVEKLEADVQKAKDAKASTLDQQINEIMEEVNSDSTPAE